MSVTHQLKVVAEGKTKRLTFRPQLVVACAQCLRSLYNALNQRVRTAVGATAREFVFNTDGQRVSVWNGNSAGQQTEGQYYWNGKPIAYYNSGGSLHFQHQDWLGTERMRTSYTGAVEDSYTSLPFGDLQTTGTDKDQYHFAELDYDSETATDHAQYRQYNPAQGRWMMPDPYNGSYDFFSPQSFNRYAYANNDPMHATDPTGMYMLPPVAAPPVTFSCPFCLAGIAVAGGIYDLGKIFGWWGSSFHGSLKPRPPSTGDPNWDGNFGESLGISTKIPQQNWGIASALGLPSAGCEFGACGDIGFGFQQGGGSNYPFTFWKSVGELAGLYDFYSNLWHVGKYHANAHQVTYEDWCGPGGSGPNLSGHDAACHVHDGCYDTNGLHVLDNFNPNLPANKASALQGCNQQLCNATRGSLVDKYFSGPGSPFGGRCR